MFSARKTEVSDEQAMQDVMLLLEDWKVPEPSPWFDARMMARFRAEQQLAPQSLFARLRDNFLFGNTAAMKPIMLSAMALLVIAGTGSYLEIAHLHKTSAPAISATVQDLQVLDNNDQAIQGMSQLLDDDGNSPQS